MELVKGLNEIYFDLELIVDFDYLFINDENSGKIDKIATDLRSRVSEHYQNLKILEEIPWSIGGRYFSPVLHGKTDVNTFKRTFGHKIKKGFSLVFNPDEASLIPDYLHVSWYQTGDLIVPQLMRDLVKGVDVVYSPDAPHTEIRIWAPRKARYLEAYGTGR